MNDKLNYAQIDPLNTSLMFKHVTMFQTLQLPEDVIHQSISSLNREAKIVLQLQFCFKQK